MALAAGGRPARAQYPAPASRRHQGRAGEEAHVGGAAGGPARGGQRHHAHPHLQPLERLLRVQGGRGGATQRGHELLGQPDLLGVAAAHRRVLRAEGPGGRRAEALAHLLQGRGRTANARAHAHAGAHRAGEHRRRAGGVPRPLQQRAGAAQLPGSHRAGHDHYPHRRAAPGQRLGAAVGLQHGPERARHGPHGGGGRGGAQAGAGAFQLRRQTRRTAGGRAEGLRPVRLRTPGARRHDRELRAPAPAGGHGGQAAGRAGGSRQGPGGVGLSHHGDAAVPVRGHPGGHQHHHGGTLQAGHRPVHPVRPRHLGPGRRRAHGPGRQGPHPGKAARQGLEGLGTARAVAQGRADAARQRLHVRR